MLSILYLVIIAVLALLSLTRGRVFIMCGFYSFYALLTVLDEGNVPRWGPFTVYRALYLILFISVVARLIQDRTFLLRVRSWPLLPYVFLLIVVLASSLYANSNSIFSSDNPDGFLNCIVVPALFWMAVAHVQQNEDLTVFAGMTVVVSLSLSVWVIWNLAQLNFEAVRGGIEGNQNYVSVFVLMGAISLIDTIFGGKNRFLRVLYLPVLLCLVLASLILASRGMMAAAAVAVIMMAARLIRRRGRGTLWSVGGLLVPVLAVAFFLPGAENFAARFQEDSLGTLNERTYVWSRSLQYFSDSGLARMVFGQGISSATFVLGPALPSHLINYHNQYLKYLMEHGVVGLFVFLGFLYAVTRRVVDCDHPRKNVMIGWLAFLFVAGLSSTIGDTHLFWIVLGIVIGAGSLASPNVLSQAALGGMPRTWPSISRVPRSAGL